MQQYFGVREAMIESISAEINRGEASRRVLMRS